MNSVLTTLFMPVVPPAMRVTHALPAARSSTLRRADPRVEAAAAPQWCLGLPMADATPASPAFTLSGGGGLRPYEALMTLVPVFKDTTCATLLGIGTFSAEEFNDAVQDWFVQAGIPARADDDALEALFARADGRIDAALQAAAVPLLSQRLLQQTSRPTRLYLFVHAMARVYDRLPRPSPPTPASRQADRWILAFDGYFRAQQADPRVLASLVVRMPAPPPAPVLDTRRQAIDDAWNPGFRSATLALAWPYGSPLYRTTGWFQQHRPPVDRATHRLADLVFSIANPLLDTQPAPLLARHWQQACADFAARHAWHDTATCLQVIHHRIARALSGFVRHRAQVSGSTATTDVLVQLRDLLRPLHALTAHMDGPAVPARYEAKAWRSYVQFFSLVDAQQQVARMTPAALSSRVRRALPETRAAGALAPVLDHLLGSTVFPGPAVRESTLYRLYYSDASTELIARALELPASALSPALNYLFFRTLAADPLLDATLQPWQTLLQDRAANSVLRSQWIAQATPADAARAFAHPGADGDPAGAGLAGFLANALGLADGQRLPWEAVASARDRLAAWLDSSAGQHAVSARLQAAASGPLLCPDAPLPLLQARALLAKAVHHAVDGWDDAALADAVARIKPAHSPVLSLALTLRARAPLLPAPACLLFAAVLLVGMPVPVAARPLLPFPLSPLASTPRADAPALEAGLAACGLGLLEDHDPDMPGWQAWQWLVQTPAFSAFARPLLQADGWHGGSDDAHSALGEQLQVAQWLLHHGVGSERLAAMRSAVEAASGIVAARDALMEHLPGTRSVLAQRVLLWLVARQLRRPELLVDDVPAWLDNGRSLLGVAFLQGVSLVESLQHGACAGWRFEALVRLPAQLAAQASDAADDGMHSLVQAQVRPALLYARAHGALPPGLDPADARPAQVAAALSFLQTRQTRLADAAGVLQRPAPQRMQLAAEQLQQAQVPTSWWNQPVAALPPGLLERYGIRPPPPLVEPVLPGEWGLVQDLAHWAALGEAALEERLVPDSLQQLLVSGALAIDGAPSIASRFEQQFAQYRRDMIDAVAEMAAHALDMLPPLDLALLFARTVTPLRMPGHDHGTLLRCDGKADEAPVFIAVIPSAGYSARLSDGERFDGTQWVPGPWYDPMAFDSGHVRAHPDAAALHRLQPAHWQAGVSLPPAGNGDDRRQALAAAAAELQYGAFFTAVKAHELAQRTGLEQLWDKERQLADGLARFSVPFYGCVQDLSRGAHSAGVLAGCALDLTFAVGPLGRFLGSTTRLALHGGELGVHALLEGGGHAVAELGRELAQLSGVALARDLGRGAVRAGRALWRLAARHAPAGAPVTGALAEAARLGPARAESALRALADEAPGLAVGRIGTAPPALLLAEDGAWFRFDADQRQAYGPPVQAPQIEGQVIDEIAPGFEVDATLGEAVTAPRCLRARRQVPLSRCEGDVVQLFGYQPSPVYDAPGDAAWFAGLEVRGENGGLADEVPFVFDGQWWQRTRVEGQLRYVRQTTLPEPVLAPRLRATLIGGAGRLARIQVHAPYLGSPMRLTVGAVIGTDRSGGQVVIARIAPGRFHVASVGSDVRFDRPTPLTLTPLEAEGFSAAHTDAVKGAWWGAFHYSQQCRLSGVALVDHFGSQLQRQVEALAEMRGALEQVQADAPYRFDTHPAHAVLSCARSNCRYIEALKQQIGAAHWRAPHSSDRWVHESLHDLLHPPATQDIATYTATRNAFEALGATLEAQHLTPRRGPAKTVALARLTLRGQARPLVFHSVSGQRSGSGLLAASNLPNGQPAPGWTVAGREITTPDAVYVDAQPTRLSIATGGVADTVPNHSLHVSDPDAMLSEERNPRAYDAERNLYYRIERWIAQGRLDPQQVTSVSVFASRPVCSSCHVSVGSLRARFPGIPFEVIERDPAALPAAPD